jgi:hypothetical protein
MPQYISQGMIERTRFRIVYAHMMFCYDDQDIETSIQVAT